jgi:hypothetical protein
MTNFYLEGGSLPESEQNQIKTREDVLKQAQRIYLTEGRKPIEIIFSFNKNHPILKRKKVILKIVDLVKRGDVGSKTPIKRRLVKRKTHSVTR